MIFEVSTHQKLTSVCGGKLIFARLMRNTDTKLSVASACNFKCDNCILFLAAGGNSPQSVYDEYFIHTLPNILNNFSYVLLRRKIFLSCIVQLILSLYRVLMDKINTKICNPSQELRAVLSLAVVAHTLVVVPALERQRQVDLCEFEVILVYKS